MDSPHFYDELSKLLLSITDRYYNSYPGFTDYSKNKVEIKEARATQHQVWIPSSEKNRVCARCGLTFQMNRGYAMYNVDSFCRYHSHGIKIVEKKDPAPHELNFQRIYKCCEQASGSAGCLTAGRHVTNQRFDSELYLFAKAPRSQGEGDERNKMCYILDCEMAYTTAGPALTRMILMDLDKNVILDILVKPKPKILDMNTRFSGLTFQNLKRVKENIYTARDKLFQYINEDTILIGHSLECHLKALRVVHENVVDTAILFPGPNGAKVGLRQLASQYLKDAEEKALNDPYEEAKACVGLIRYKLDQIQKI